MFSPQFIERVKGNLFNKPKCADFRCFIQRKWMEHKDELMRWEKRRPEYDQNYYFRKHKWMLKRMYQEENRTRK